MLREVGARRLLDVKGTIEPRWDVINGMVAHSAGPGASVRATIRPFRVGGMIKADTTAAMLAQMYGEFGIDLDTAQAYGVAVGPAAIVLKAGGGYAKFDPIVTHVNTGPALIRGRLALDDEMGLWLKLDGSRVDDAAIDDKVSTALLSFVAPVLNDATGVTGKVSVVIADSGAEIPLTAKHGSARLDGVMAFKDVVCKPGPFAAEVLSLTGRPDLKLAIAEPVALSVADGRVKQSGLSIPVGNSGAKLGLAGSVGFDQTVEAKATVPITASMLGRDPALNKLVAGTNITIPIGGTLSKPSIDRRALQTALRDATKSLAEKGLKDEAGGSSNASPARPPAATGPRPTRPGTPSGGSSKAWARRPRPPSPEPSSGRSVGAGDVRGLAGPGIHGVLDHVLDRLGDVGEEVQAGQLLDLADRADELLPVGVEPLVVGHDDGDGPGRGVHPAQVVGARREDQDHLPGDRGHEDPGGRVERGPEPLAPVPPGPSGPLMM